jgi:hypothetical protein
MEGKYNLLIHPGVNGRCAKRLYTYKVTAHTQLNFGVVSFFGNLMTLPKDEKTPKITSDFLSAREIWKPC